LSKRDQKLEKESDIKNKVSFFHFSFRTGSRSPPLHSFFYQLCS